MRFDLEWVILVVRNADAFSTGQAARAATRIRARQPSDHPTAGISICKFRCARSERFIHGRIVFVSDSAHQVSTFGERGGNRGMQDADNIGWQLAAVLKGEASESLIHSHDDERIIAYDENILDIGRSTDFICPKYSATEAYRNAVL